MTQSEDYLAHFGVKGMKWGVRHNRFRGSSNSVKRSSRGQRTKWKDKSGREKAKTVLKVAGGAAVVGLTIYGGSKAIKEGKNAMAVLEANKSLFSEPNSEFRRRYGANPPIKAKLGMQYTNANLVRVKNKRPTYIPREDTKIDLDQPLYGYRNDGSYSKDANLQEYRKKHKMGLYSK